MNPPPNIRDLLQGHVTLQLESLDRLYLNGYLPKLQYGAGLVQFLSRHRGHPIASPALLGHITGQPELWLERRQHPTSGATDRHQGRSTSAGLEIWPPT